MLLYILGSIGIFVVGYFVGANNPLKSVKAKIAAETQTLVKKV